MYIFFSDPEYAAYRYTELKKRLPMGPLRNCIPKQYWHHISESTLDSYLADSFKDADLLWEKVPDARVIVLEYREEVFPEVLNGLNERGKNALKVMTPWLVVTLIDNFDNFLMDHPLKNMDDGDGNFPKEDKSKLRLQYFPVFIFVE